MYAHTQSEENLHSRTRVQDTINNYITSYFISILCSQVGMVQATNGDMKQCFYEHIPNFYFLIMFIYQFDVFGFFLTDPSGSAQHGAFFKTQTSSNLPKSDALWHTRNANVFRSEAPSVKITMSGLLLNEFCNLPISALQCGAHSMTRPTWFLKEIASSFTQLFPFSTLLDCFVTKINLGILYKSNW